METKNKNSEVTQWPGKRALNMDDLQAYTGMKKSYLYRLVRAGIIPHTKPGGRLLYFDREKIDAWLLSDKADNQTL
jgi:prophage regulatory protein